VNKNKNKYFPLHVHSHYSLLDGLSKPKDIAKRCLEIGSEGSAVTDHGNISCAIAYSDAMKGKGLKPIIGCEFYVCDEDPTIRSDSNRRLSHMLLLAKNIQGWRELIEISSRANDKENFYYKPRLDLETIASLPHRNLIAISGHFGSTVTDVIFEEPRLAGGCYTSDAAKRFLSSTMDKDLEKIPGWCQYFTDISEECSPPESLLPGCL